jgi:hypothetical protein
MRQLWRNQQFPVLRGGRTAAHQFGWSATLRKRPAGQRSTNETGDTEHQAVRLVLLFQAEEMLVFFRKRAEVRPFVLTQAFEVVCEFLE